MPICLFEVPNCPGADLSWYRNDPHRCQSVLVPICPGAEVSRIHGFHTGIQFIPELSIECKNFKSATCQPNVVTELIETEVNKGYVCGPFVNIPFKQFHINPVGVAEGKYS